MKRLLLSALAVLILFVALALHETRRSPSGGVIRSICKPILEREVETGVNFTDPLSGVCRSVNAPLTNDPIDTLILVVITMACVLTVLGLLFGTHRDDWDARNIGMFWFFFGVAILFGRELAIRWGWTTRTASLAEPITDLSRACLIVGGFVFVWARFDWMRYRWRMRHA